VLTRLKKRLHDASTPTVTLSALVAAFLVYFCMYGLRKPFAAASFKGQSVHGLELKTALVIAQVVGYALSKFVSIRLLSELPRQRRGLVLFATLAAAEIALLGVGLFGPAGQVLAMFCNGLPLGAVWGLVFAYLEGRRTSELLGAGLSLSYIVSSGAVKSAGRYLLADGVAERWMPALTGALFFAAVLPLLWLLEALPEPSELDRRERVERRPMTGVERRRFLRTFAPGLIALVTLYVLLTAYRDFRDNFAVELWSALGYEKTPQILAVAELPVALIVLLSLAAIFFVRDHRRAFFVVHAIMAGGAALIGASTWAYGAGLLPGSWWMVAVGAGLYMGYVPYGCVLFDRLLALTQSAGTAVFLIYVADASGYAGSVLLLLYKNFGAPHFEYLPFFVRLSYGTAAVALAGFALSAMYFARRARLAWA
jgi:hypothetical protein